MYQEHFSLSDEDNILNIDDIIRKIRLIVLRRWSWLFIIVIVSCTIIVGASKLLYSPEYESYVTYLVTMSGNVASDAEAAKMLGSHMTSVFSSSGLEDMIVDELEGQGESPQWLEEKYISNDYDSSTNLFTIYAVGDTPEHTYSLLMALENIMPEYAARQLGFAILTKIDENIAVSEPKNSYSIVKMLFIGIIAGIFAACLYIFISVAKRDIILGKEDMKNISSMQMLGELERVKIRNSNIDRQMVSLLSANKRNRGYAESMRRIRHKVESLMSEKQAKILMVTSSVSGEGKTTISCNLSLALANNKNKVLLIDADIYHAGVREQLQLDKNIKTLPDYLCGEAELEDVIIKNLPIDVIYGDADKKINSLIFDSDRMQDMFDRLREEYDFIIIDTAPAVLRSDADLLTKYADSLLFVVSYGNVPKNIVSRGLRSIDLEHVQNIGYILNGVENDFKRYSYSYYK